METPKHDKELLKQDVLRVLRQAFGDRTPQLAEMADMMVSSFDELHCSPGFILPAGKNVYSLRYTVRMTLEGDHKVRGENVREARQNLLTTLTQELSLRELVAQSIVMPICPIEDIDIKEPELLHGVEPYFYYVPYAYMPKENAVRLAYDQLLEHLTDIVHKSEPMTEAEKRQLLDDIAQVKAQSNEEPGLSVDLDADALSFLKETIHKNPDKVRELLKQWEDDDFNRDFPDFVREALQES
jgi:hypothetical protein